MLSYETGKPIAEALVLNQTLTHLDVSSNCLGDGGPDVGKNFADALTVNTALRFLSLDHNRLGPTAGIEIAHAMTRNNTLLHLHLDDNRFDSEVGDGMLITIKENRNLLTLKLTALEVGKDAFHVIDREMRSRQPGVEFDAEHVDHADA